MWPLRYYDPLTTRVYKFDRIHQNLADSMVTDFSKSSTAYPKFSTVHTKFGTIYLKFSIKIRFVMSKFFHPTKFLNTANHWHHPPPQGSKISSTCRNLYEIQVHNNSLKVDEPVARW
jgi:hypothetical protein